MLTIQEKVPTPDEYVEDLMYTAAIEHYTNGPTADLEILEWELTRVHAERNKCH